MYIRCKNCDHYEKTDKSFFIKLIGGTLPLGSYWAWVTYFFAGTGFALPICIAIITGGVAMLVFADEIVAWVSKRYDCPKCNGNQWIAIDDETVEKVRETAQKVRMAELKIQLLNQENAKYKSEIRQLSNELTQRKNELQEYIKTHIKVDSDNAKNSEYIKRLESDIDFLMEQWENQENKILELIQNQQAKDELENIASAYTKQEMKVIDKIKMRFSKLYQKVSISDKSYKRLVRMNDDELLKFEQEIKNLNEDKFDFRDNIYGTDVKEIDFNQSGRFYTRKTDNHYNVVLVGNKNTQNRDIDWLKKRYPK